ncbi:hypothetical protein ABEX38_29770 [Priestia megaterium]
MSTIYQIKGQKSFRQLTTEEKAMLQARQNELVLNWQAEGNEMKQREIFDELLDSLQGYIKNRAYREAEKWVATEQEEIEGLLYEVLAETVLEFDISKSDNFQPVFIYNATNALKMLYRQNSYDLHDTSDKLDKPVGNEDKATMGDLLETHNDFAVDIQASHFVDEVIDECFGANEMKKTIVHMFLQDFKRNEIVQAILPEGKSTDSVARLVNRTISDFKLTYVKLTECKAN